MLLQGTIIGALLLGLLLAWSAGAVVCFAVLTSLGRDEGWMKRVLLSGVLSAVLLALVFGINAWIGPDDLSLFGYYLIGTMSIAVLSIVHLAVRILQRRS